MSKVKLWLSVGILSFTLFFRGLINIIRFADYHIIDDDYDTSIEEDTYFAPLFDFFFFVFSDLLPITSQLLSMIFGLIRKNSNS